MEHLMNFGEALEFVKAGARIARKNWNGKGQYVFLADDVEFHTDADISEFYGNPDGVYVSAVLVLRTAQGNMQVGWLATQSDMLSEDWYIVDDGCVACEDCAACETVRQTFAEYCESCT